MRPIRHNLDETIRGYAACSFLALALTLKTEPGDRLAAIDKGVRIFRLSVSIDLVSLSETANSDRSRPPEEGSALAVCSRGSAIAALLPRR